MLSVSAQQPLPSQRSLSPKAESRTKMAGEKSLLSLWYLCIPVNYDGRWEQSLLSVISVHSCESTPRRTHRKVAASEMKNWRTQGLGEKGTVHLHSTCEFLSHGAQIQKCKSLLLINLLCEDKSLEDLETSQDHWPPDGPLGVDLPLTTIGS